MSRLRRTVRAGEEEREPARRVAMGGRQRPRSEAGSVYSSIHITRYMQHVFFFARLKKAASDRGETRHGASLLVMNGGLIQASKGAEAVNYDGAWVCE